MEFKKRLEAPSRDNKNYYSTKNEYYSSAERLVGQCTWYACGRFLELNGEFKLENANAKNWFKQDKGYKKGNTPKLGAIMCWDGEYGHVAIVEEIHDGYVTTSEYNYAGDKKFHVRDRYAKNDYNTSGSHLKFQGFIYSPNEFVIVNKKSIDEVARDVIAGKYGNGQERKDKLTAEGYNYEEVQNKVNEILHSGKKSIDEIAKEVIAGKWGNGEERKKKLTQAGYNYDEVQNRVNYIMHHK